MFFFFRRVRIKQRLWWSSSFFWTT